jgi:hypothetical protein
MKEIKAFEATDGTPFFTEHECVKHEKLRAFQNWHAAHQIRSHSKAEPQTQHLHNWLLKNAEDIRGFLPPVETATPELDIADLEWYRLAGGSRMVKLSHVEKWLAGDLK